MWKKKLDLKNKTLADLTKKLQDKDKELQKLRAKCSPNYH